MSKPLPPNAVRFRSLAENETHVLRKMLYIALFVRPGETPFPATILDKPELAKYISDWNSRPLDIAVVAERNGTIVGLAWGRTFSTDNPSYGFISEDIPEITVAVLANYRNQGIGRSLLQQLEEAYKQTEATALSLSVDQLSPAKRLYSRFGFSIYEEAGTAYTMRKLLPRKT